MTRFTIFLFLSLWGLHASAQGAVKVKNGGDAIVCFSIPLDQAVSKGNRISAAGREAVTEVYSLDYWLLKHSNAYDRLIRPWLESLPARSVNSHPAYDIFVTPLFVNPDNNYEDLYRTPPIDSSPRGLKTLNGLVEVQDEDLVTHIPENCAVVQAVVRKGGVYYYDEFIFSKLAEDKKVDQISIIELHETFAKVILDQHSGDTLAFPVSNSHELLVEYLSLFASCGYQGNKGKPHSCDRKFLDEGIWNLLVRYRLFKLARQ